MTPHGRLDLQPALIRNVGTIGSNHRQPGTMRPAAQRRKLFIRPATMAA